MRTVITGGSGYLGDVVLEHLVSSGHAIPEREASDADTTAHLAVGLARSTPMLAAKARVRLDWVPGAIGLVDDVTHGSYNTGWGKQMTDEE